jgi:hypothetical protein
MGLCVRVIVKNMEVKLSNDLKIRELQERALVLGKQVTIDTKALELSTESKWEERVKQEEVIKSAETLFSDPLKDTDSEPIPF